MGQLVEVNVEGEGNCVAKIVEECPNGNFKIKYLSAYKESGKMYKYEKNLYEIEPEMIAVLHDTDDESDIGYVQVERNLFEKDSESDYDPSADEDDDDDEDEECVDSDEEFVDDE